MVPSRGVGVCVVSVAIVGLSHSTVAQTAPASIGEPVVIGERWEMQSEILDETRRLTVGTPSGYDEGQERYPVVFVLDGGAHFHHTTGTADFLARNGRVPPVIVVAISNTDRTRDLSPPSSVETEVELFPTHGGADDFLRFITDELTPWVDERYRTRPHRVLIGHSLGGLFALHALVTRPDVFDAYIAISPSLQWNDQHLVERAETAFEAMDELTVDLYLTVGNEGGALLGGVRKLSGVFDEHAPAGFRWAFRLMEEETHGSVPLRSTRQGLEAIFAGWDLHDVMTTFDQGGLEAVDAYYRRGGERFGYERSTPDGKLLRIVLRLLSDDRLDEAADVLLHDPEQWPPPSSLLYRLGEGYADRGESERGARLLHPGAAGQSGQRAGEDEARRARGRRRRAAPRLRGDDRGAACLRGPLPVHGGGRSDHQPGRRRAPPDPADRSGRAAADPDRGARVRRGEHRHPAHVRGGGGRRRDRGPDAPVWSGPAGAADRPVARGDLRSRVVSAARARRARCHDSMLFLGGNLDSAMGGKHPFPPVETWGFSQHAPTTASTRQTNVAST